MKEWGREREEGEGVGEREEREREGGRERVTETDHLSGVLKFHLLLYTLAIQYNIRNHVQYMCIYVLDAHACLCMQL